MSKKSKDLPSIWEELTPEQQRALLKWFEDVFKPVAQSLNDLVAWFERFLEKLAEEMRRT